MGIKGDFSPGEEDTMISIGYYAGKEYPSPFCAMAVKSVAEAQIWLKNHLSWLEEASFGFSIWETNSWDRGRESARANRGFTSPGSGTEGNAMAGFSIPKPAGALPSGRTKGFARISRSAPGDKRESGGEEKRWD